MIATVESTGPGGRRQPRWRRWLRHLLTTPYTVRRDFPLRVLKAIGAAIELAEAGHSGEIVFVAEGSLPWSLLRHNGSVRTRAVGLFGQLRVWDTERNNGVLLYVGLADRAVEIVADRGIAARVEPAVWHRICQDLLEHCRQGRFEAGSVQAVRDIGALLQREFALAPGQTRANELPDRPIAL